MHCVAACCSDGAYHTSFAYCLVGVVNQLGESSEVKIPYRTLS